MKPDSPGRGSRLRGGLLAAGGAIAAAAVAVAVGVTLFAHALPPLDFAVVEERSTVVLDRDGNLLRPFATRDGRWRLPVSIGDVDPQFIAMLKAYEDSRFASHHGVDLRALLRAAFQLIWHGRVVSGASTLTMQVARLLEPRAERSLAAKLRQMIRAIQLEQRLSKTQILDLYLALAPYGGNLEGVRAASLSYFGREPKRLSVAEAALLVALPQAPEARRPDRFPAAARRARDRVLERVAAASLVAEDEVRRASGETPPAGRHAFPMHAAHLAEAIIAERPAEAVHGLTIDGRLQESLEGMARERAEQLGPRLSAAIIVVHNATGEIRAHVGSAGYLESERAGAIDMTVALRSPGSALKPFIYALAFEQGIAHPETLLDDRPTRFGIWQPENFDLHHLGTVTARRALQLSLNVPAVELLQQVGVARLLARLDSAGARAVLPRDAPPGLAVGLGGLGVTLTDLARLYAGLARGGSVPVLRRRQDPEHLTETGVIADPVAAWYVADILRGAPPPDRALANRIAYKTGTSYGYRDAWAVGFDRDFTIGVWVGRPDGSAVPGLVGRVVAAPTLFDAFARLGIDPQPIPRPPHALVASTATLPPPLRHVRDDVPKTLLSLAQAPLRISFPVDGSRVELGITGGTEGGSRLVMKATGGSPPLTWLVNGAPVEIGSLRRNASWHPDGAGFVQLSVIDAKGASDSVSVRIE
jgi:penicillin-binding protein 1C